jgi:hypothetical protein
MLYRVKYMGKTRNKTDLHFVEKEPQEKNTEIQKQLLDKALYAVSTAACNSINQNRAKKGGASVTETTARDIVLCWANG